MKEDSLANSPLGKIIEPPNNYDKNVLVAIKRNQNSNHKTYGCDRWTAYELSWLNKNGIPQIRICEIVYEALSPYIIESKSLKLYLNAFNNTHYSSEESVLKTIQRDLKEKIQSNVNVTCNTPQTTLSNNYERMVLIEDSLTEVHQFKSFEFSDHNIDETLYTHVYRSLCPVTSQPDFATLFISYSGKQINKQSLFNYLISSRNKNNFHEDCINQIFNDLLNTQSIKELTIQGSFLRRGGIDITPIRSTRKHYQTIPTLYQQ